MLIIADDLTGAADCGIACGAGAVVLLGKPDGLVPDAAVLAVDADTRSMAPGQAAETIAALVRSYDVSPERERVLLYKKLDSTLRGNVAAELASALNARRGLASRTERVVALFAPASPDHSRTTLCGHQLVHGMPLEQTDMWRGEISRPRSNIAEILRETGLSCGMIELALVRAGARSLENAMIRLAGEMDVLVCDAETDADLYAIAKAAMVLHPKTVWCGSAGLARQIPQAAGFAL
ncbi:MAG TPA: four-carbon acid sugar kinase family protein, partial [Terracidiphilus sp.]